MELVSPSELRRWDRPGPRYTSYPTVPVWGPLSQDAVDAALSQAREPAQVYLHVPFCAEQCTFCGCNMVVAGRRFIGERYIQLIEKQLAELPLPGQRLKVQRIHWGGGTPTWFTPDEMVQLHRLVLTRFEPIEGAELSIEADPQITTREHLEALAAEGYNRLSLGVQSFDDGVLTAVNRPQWGERIADLLQMARELGWWGLNLDLMYGLPTQTAETFAATLERTISLKPDRLAVFGYAHVPWLHAHMKKIDADTLPGVDLRATQYLMAQRAFAEAGYDPLGLDHFALASDQLAVAQRARGLHRNFMGYTTLADVDMIGLGMSAISEVGGVYWQAHTKLATWMKAMEAGESLVKRGWVMTREDRLRRHVVNAIMCNLHLDIPDVEARYGIDFHEHFADALPELDPLVADGFVLRGDDHITVTERGRVLVRLAAMPFDAYLKRKKDDAPRFSRTI